jgi:hypothetical protein
VKGRANAGYETRLFRGWEWVRLRYEIEKDHVVVREWHTWTGAGEKRVPIANLGRDANRVWSRQPANRVALLVMVVSGAILAANLMMREGGVAGGTIDWHLWGPGIAVATLAWFVLWGTRGRREWTHFPGREGRTGLFLLREKRNRSASQAFVDVLRTRLR